MCKKTNTSLRIWPRLHESQNASGIIFNYHIWWLDVIKNLKIHTCKTLFTCVYCAVNRRFNICLQKTKLRKSSNSKVLKEGNILCCSVKCIYVFRIRASASPHRRRRFVFFPPKNHIFVLQKEDDVINQEARWNSREHGMKVWILFGKDKVC